VYEITRRAALHSQVAFLLHAVTGGVGLAAMHELSWLQVRMHATAGQMQKHQLARGFGVEKCYSSRSVGAFTNGIVSHLQQARLASACNSLTNEFIAVSVAALQERASFQEIGKRGAWSEAHAAATTGAWVSVIDMATDAAHDFEWFNGLLLLLSAKVGNGVVQGLPLVEYGMNVVRAAFQLLKAGRHVGKVVVASSFADVLSTPLRRGQLPKSADECKCTTECLSSRPTMAITTLLAVVAEIAGRDVEVDAPLMEAGVDSLGAVELRNQLGKC